MCAYKGHATYWSVRLPSGLHENIAWTYLEPRHDGQAQPRPRSPWSAPRWWERTADMEARL